MNAVKELRDRFGISQKELALTLGVSQPTVSEWEHGKKDPSGERLEKLSSFFGVPRSVILCYDPIDAGALHSAESPAKTTLMEDVNIALVARGMKKLSEEQQARMIAMARAAFPDAFGEDLK